MREGHPPSGRIREVPKSPVAAPKARHTRKSKLFKFGWHHEVFRYSRPNARDGSIFLFGEFHRDTGRPFRGVRRGRLSTSPRRCEPFLRKSNANPQLPLGRCGHRPYAKSGEFLKRRRGGRLCPPGKTRLRNAKIFGEFATSLGRTGSSAPTQTWRILRYRP